MFIIIMNNIIYFYLFMCINNIYYVYMFNIIYFIISSNLLSYSLYFIYFIFILLLVVLISIWFYMINPINSSSYIYVLTIFCSLINIHYNVNSICSSIIISICLINIICILSNISYYYICNIIYIV